MTKKIFIGTLVCSTLCILSIFTAVGFAIGDKVARENAFAEERLQTLKHQTELEKDTRVQYTISEKERGIVYFVTKDEIVTYRLSRDNLFTYNWQKNEEFPL